MTSFESMLLDKGYTKHIFNCKTMEHEPTEKHEISSMVNLDHRYILGDRYIVFGLHERHRPPTLISPRPRITIQREREINGEKVTVFEDETLDDSMNVLLTKIDNEDIYDALYDDSIKFFIDLTGEEE